MVGNITVHRMFNSLRASTHNVLGMRTRIFCLAPASQCVNKCNTDGVGRLSCEME